MKQTIFTFLLLSVIIISCRKDKLQSTIQQQDQTAIQNYITANGITGMVRDTFGNDTTGIYYKINLPGSGPALAYSDSIAFVYSLKTFDNTYEQPDTIYNHYAGYVGHITNSGLPSGVQLAIHDVMKYGGASMRLLIPSRMAYGINGTGSGSSQVANNRIQGNECLDYYVHSIRSSEQPAYDDIVIQNYLKNQGLTGYTKTASGLYYKILTPGTGTDPITVNSTITDTHTGQLLDAKLIDSAYNGVNYATDIVSGFVSSGIVEGLENYATVGTKISLIFPSGLGYGNVLGAGGLAPPNSCLRYTWDILTVTP